MTDQSALDRWISLAARMPGPLLPVGVMAAAAASTGSMFTTATLTAAALVSSSISAPASGMAAERFGARNVLLISASVHVLMLILMVSSVERLTRGDTLASNAVIYTLLLVFTFGAGLSTPAAATFGRTRLWSRAVGSTGERPQLGPAGPGPAVRQGLRAQAWLDDVALIAAPLMLGLLSFSFGPTVGLLSSAVLTAVAVPLCAVDRTQPLEVPADSARLPLGGAEHGQQRLMEHRGLVPEVASAPVRTLKVAAPASWVSGISSSIALAAALGLVLGGVWITVLDAAQALNRPTLFALPLGLVAAAGVFAARWRSSSFTAPLALRRRRLHALALLVLSLLTVPVAVVLPGGVGSVLVLSSIVGLQSALMGLLARGLYAGLAVGAAASKLPTAMSAVAGGVLLGTALGLTLAGIAADEVGPGWSAAVPAGGSLLAAVVVLTGQLWGSPAQRAR